MHPLAPFTGRGAHVAAPMGQGSPSGACRSRQAEGGRRAEAKGKGGAAKRQPPAGDTAAQGLPWAGVAGCGARPRCRRRRRHGLGCGGGVERPAGAAGRPAGGFGRAGPTNGRRRRRKALQGQHRGPDTGRPVTTCVQVVTGRTQNPIPMTPRAKNGGKSTLQGRGGADCQARSGRGP